jgi:hypothetical protein
MKNIEIEKTGGSGRKQATVRSSATRVKHRLKHFRRLKWNEVVNSGDFLINDARDFEPWDGPGGFRADSFLKPIYRLRRRSARN